MGTLIYCDGNDCQVSDHSSDEIIFTIDSLLGGCAGLEHLCEKCLFINFDKKDINIDMDYVTKKEAE